MCVAEWENSVESSRLTRRSSYDYVGFSCFGAEENQTRDVSRKIAFVADYNMKRVRKCTVNAEQFRMQNEQGDPNSETRGAGRLE
jgi:hypothetical protein